MNILTKFGHGGQIWPIVSTTDLVVIGEKVNTKKLIPKWKKNEVQFHVQLCFSPP